LPSHEWPLPDLATVHSELRRPGMTLMLLWEEYCDTAADSFSYSWFRARQRIRLNGQLT
jgi:transposase